MPEPGPGLDGEGPRLHLEDGAGPVTAALEDGERRCELALAWREPAVQREAPAACPAEAPAPPARSTPASARRPLPTGRLTLDTVPWTRVFLGTRSLGDTPVVEATLPAGRHTLRLVNAESGIQQSLTVDIREGELTARRVELSRHAD